MFFARLKRILVGEPLSNQMAMHERIPKWKALAVLSSDALSSVAYATEEILIPLAAFSSAAVVWSIPIGLAIAGLLIIVTISYRQTIDCYPSGGGAYIVAKENIGIYAGLVAAGSLLIDYVLTVAVSVAAGVENLAAAFPLLIPHKEALGTVIVVVVMLFNLRGVRESATIFAIPTYLFVFSFALMILVGIGKVLTGAVIPVAPLVHEVYPAVPLFLILHAFSSGCSALTGIEAISNGIPVFRQPAQTNAKITLFWMALILGVLFLGLTGLSHVYGLIPKAGETSVSLLSHAIFGNSWFYYLIQGSTALILILAANTSYADFPRLSSLLAKDRYLPRQLASVGDRLVFSNGILGLSAAAILLIIFFKGDTHLLIPLYAVGVFLSFTLSQSGMILHHLREREKRWFRSLIFNALGALTTLTVLVVIASTKFMDGAWMVVLLIPMMVLLFTRIHSHYLAVGSELSLIGQTPPGELRPIKHTVIVPVSGLHRGVLDALRYAMSISDDVRACYVEIDSDTTERMKSEWNRWAHEIPFVVLKSPYRSVIRPLLEYVDDVEQTTHRDMITIIIPEFVTSKWRFQLLHNQTALLIRAALMFRRGKVVTSVRYHLRNT
ncbi:APC family permease [Bdellovibrionota bacterium FG-1]